MSLQEKFPVNTRAHPNWLVALLRSLFVRTDVARWKKIVGQVPPWDERNRIIASHISPGSAVLDLGAGAQTLRNHLPPGCTYQPCDVVVSTPDCIPCDFNAGQFPALPRTYDVVVCSGLIEYIRNPERFLTTIRTYGRTILLSYAPRPPEASVVERLVRGWLTHLTEPELLAMLAKHQLACQTIDSNPNGQKIYRLTSAPQGAPVAPARPRRLRIAFMTSVARNVGDEFIREGIRSFLDEVVGQYDSYYVDKPDLGTLSTPLLDEPELLADKFRDADVVIQAGAPVYWALGPNCCYNVEWAQGLWFDRIFKLGPQKLILNLGAGSCQADEHDLQPLLDDPQCGAFARQAATACRWTTVRDGLAHEYLQRLGVAHEYLACPAFHAARRFEGGRWIQPHDVLAICVRRLAGFMVVKPQDPAAWLAILQEVLPRLRQKHRLAFVAHDQDDLAFQTPLAQPGERVFYSPDFRDYITFYSRVKAVVANRVHGAVCAAGFGRPAVIIGNDSRIGIARPIGIPATDVHSVTADWICDHLESELAQGDELTHRRLALRESTARQYIDNLSRLMAEAGLS